jgi:EAL domain-containing protein (putative c-di-GMP-specific phosphodiesterase class I)
MALLDAPTPIETDDHVLRARRTAAFTRIATALAGIALILAKPGLLSLPALGVLGFVVIALTALVQVAAPRLSWLTIEESISPIAGLLIIGLGPERVTVLTVLWLVALASGVLARGGRVHWFGRNVVLIALVLPMFRYWSVSGEYVALLVASVGLLLTSGRLTSELNHLLKAARLQAENAETLLFAGDIAARVAERDGAGQPAAGAPRRELADATGAGAGPQVSEEDRQSLARLLSGEGITMVVQAIVDLRANTIHGYEALARFAGSGPGVSPLHWFSLAEKLGERTTLELACLRGALQLFTERPAGTLLSLNLSAPALLDPRTKAIMAETLAAGENDLDGLIIEITEETLVKADMDLDTVIAPLRARGARLAVDDMGAGYSGLRQITSVRPGYLKLDRSLISGIDGDDERAALVGALAGYSSKVGSLLVAEGVETEQELAVVRALGVPLVQGFYFSRPAAPWPELTPAQAAPAPAIRSAGGENGAGGEDGAGGERTSHEVLLPAG